MGYLVRMPRWGNWLYPKAIFKGPSTLPGLYLSFDDGPHPEITPWVLDRLKEFDARASFFCVGQNVRSYPEVFRRIIDEGHTLGNHTDSHLDGWKTPTARYLQDLDRAADIIPSQYFRPPYGRIRPAQVRGLKDRDYRLVLWDVLSGDFDLRISGEECALRVQRTAVPGSLVVFHDSEKAWQRIRKALPEVLAHFAHRQWNFHGLPKDYVH